MKTNQRRLCLCFASLCVLAVFCVGCGSAILPNGSKLNEQNNHNDDNKDGDIDDRVVKSTICRPENFTGTTLFVDRDHPQAADAIDNGSEDKPWKTIVYAAQQAKAGERIYIKAGIYNDGDVLVENSGEKDREIIFMAYPSHERQAILDNAAFRIKGKSHIHVCGLKVQNVSSSAFQVLGPVDASGNQAGAPSQNIAFSGNETFNSVSSAFSVWGVRWLKDPGTDYDNIRDVIIENNLIRKACNGGYNENITIANGVSNVDIRYNKFRDPAVLDSINNKGGEGIDLKEGVRDARIHDNIFGSIGARGTHRKAIYLDGGRDSFPTDSVVPVVENIEIFNNLIFDDPNDAIAVTTEGVGVVKNVRIFNNVINEAQRNGILVYKHPEGHAGHVQNVKIVNNTVYRGGISGTGWGGIRVDHDSATEVVVQNNIAWWYDANVSEPMRFGVLTNNSTVKIDTNICNAHSVSYFRTCDSTKDPAFVKQGENFNLQNTSPAIGIADPTFAPDFDANYVARNSNATIDIGAYEYSQK